MLLQGSGTPAPTSFARLLNPFPELRKFTVCYRIRMHRYREEDDINIYGGPLLSYALLDTDSSALKIDHRLYGYQVCLSSICATSNVITPLWYWSHFCFTFDDSDKSWTFYMNGVKEAGDKLYNFSKVIFGNGAFVIGQQQDNFGGGFEGDRSYSGEITQLNFWHRVLDASTIKNIAECRDKDEGDALAWSTLRWNSSGEVEWLKFGGEIGIPINDAENTRMFTETVGWAEHCSSYLGSSYLWLGAQDGNVEGRWEHFESNETITYQGRWRGGGPNGGTVENCLAMMYGPGINGLCVNNRPSLTGYRHSDIFWDNETQAWKLASKKTPGSSALHIPDSPSDYPLGKKTWEVKSQICGYSRGEKVQLTLSACIFGQYTCDDGSCIALRKKCDLRMDCPDNSDETKCTLLSIPVGYSNTIPPPPLVQSEPLPVNISVFISSFPGIKTEVLSFETNFVLLLMWQDSRLKFLDLKNERSLNMLTPEEVQKIWFPEIFFYNDDGNLFSNLEQGSRVELIAGGTAVQGGSDNSDEANIISEGVVAMSQRYNVHYSCDFDLLMFPFDAQ
ncbi:uncharacterized protein LOC108670860, partial [Hyalella azteca]|uniref:Uncharacterized protein LOC108670860 n=1 Tax=Hyalella azteca TaxID=294128 RepID=A0A979FR11_HYAAZ